MIIKLTPNVTDISEIALSAQEGGADAISAVNTFQGLAIDYETGKMLLSTTFGGVSGYPIKPLALAKVHKIYNKINIPIIGMGGICKYEDVIEFFRIGSSMVQIGTLNYRDPSLIVNIYDNLKKFMSKNNFSSISDLQEAIIIKILYTILILALISCYPSPRYTNLISKSDSRDTKDTFYGMSSFYGLGDGFDGNLTANGEVYDKDGISAAHKTLPLNSIVRVTNLDNGKSVKLKINDRGPYIKGRILDCSYGAAIELDFVEQGTTEVKVEVIKWGDNEYKNSFIVLISLFDNYLWKYKRLDLSWL